MKKIFSVLLAVLMLLTPVLGCAASAQDFLDMAWNDGRALNTTVSMKLGDYLLKMIDDENVNLAAEVINSASVGVLTAPEGPWKVALNLSRNEVFNVIGEEDGGLTYLTSTMMGDDVWAADETEMISILNYLIDLMVMQNAVSEEEAAQAKMLMLMGPALLTEAIASAEPINYAAIDISSMEKLAADLDARAVPVTAVAQSDRYDTAASGSMYVLTGNDVVSFVEAFTDMMMSMPAFVQTFSAMLEGDNPETVIDEMNAQLRENLAESSIMIPVTVLENEKGEIVYVSAVVVMDNVVAAVNDTEVTMNSTPTLIEYARKSVKAGYVHTYTLSALQENEAVDMSLVINTDDASEQNVTFNVKMTQAGTEVGGMSVEWNSNKWDNGFDSGENSSLAFTVNDDGVKENLVITYGNEALYEDGNAYVDYAVRVKLNGQELLKFVVEMDSCDPLPTLTGSETVRIGQLMAQSDPADENSPLNQYLATLQGAALQNVIVIAQNLPLSLMMQLLGQ